MNKKEYLFIVANTVREKEETTKLVDLINTRIKEIKEDTESDSTITIASYNNKLTIKVDREKAEDISFITNGVVSGRSKKLAINDCSIEAIDYLGEKLNAMQKSERPNNVIVFMEEGLEDNASEKHSAADLRWIMGEQIGIYSWLFSRI